MMRRASGRIMAQGFSRLVGYGVMLCVVPLILVPQVVGASTSGWAIQPTVTPAGATDTLLNGVSCTSRTACTAVGIYRTSSSVVTLAEFWNGVKWAMQTTPNPVGATLSELNSVSCTSPTACTAVGQYYDSTGYLPLSERWNGKRWAIQTTPTKPTVLLGDLTGVSCTSGTACTAVGFYTNASFNTVTLAESWNGAEWTIESTPNPTTFGQLLGVSCTSATACTAVGYYNPSGTSLALAETWNGARWALKSVPKPAKATTSTLNGGVVPCNRTL